MVKFYEGIRERDKSWSSSDDVKEEEQFYANKGLNLSCLIHGTCHSLRVDDTSHRTNLFRTKGTMKWRKFTQLSLTIVVLIYTLHNLILEKEANKLGSTLDIYIAKRKI